MISEEVNCFSVIYWLFIDVTNNLELCRKTSESVQGKDASISHRETRDPGAGEAEGAINPRAGGRFACVHAGFGCFAGAATGGCLGRSGRQPSLTPLGDAAVYEGNSGWANSEAQGYQRQ